MPPARLRTLTDRARFWGVTAAERAESFPCDRALAGHPDVEAFLRGVDVDAPPDVLFRWLCQLKLAPYSYDWIDNRGRRSPETLTPGAEQLALGQRFLVFEITDFATDDHISGRAPVRFARIYGDLAATYRVRPRGAGGSRLVVKLVVTADGPVGRLRRRLLAFGDLIMMRKQLLRLRALAERSARRPS